MHNAGLIRAIRGAPLTVLVTLLLNQEQPMGTEQLVAATGYSKKTVIDSLNTLQALNLAGSHTRYQGWRATVEIPQLFLAAPLDPGSDAPGEVEILHLPGSSGSYDHDPNDHNDHSDPEPTTTTTTGEVEILHLPDPWPDLVTLLVERCTAAPAAAREAIACAYEANCYPSYVRYQILRWLAYCLGEHGRSIRHIGSYIAKRIAQDIPCPEWSKADDNSLSWEITRAETAWQREEEEDEQADPLPASPDTGEEREASPLVGGTVGGQIDPLPASPASGEELETSPLAGGTEGGQIDPLPASPDTGEELEASPLVGGIEGGPSPDTGEELETSPLAGGTEGGPSPDAGQELEASPLVGGTVGGQEH